MTNTTPSPAPKELTAEQRDDLAGILCVISHQLDLPIPGTDFEDGKPRIHLHASDGALLIEYVQMLTARLAEVEGLLERIWQCEYSPSEVMDAVNEWRRELPAIDSARANANEGDGSSSHNQS